MSTLTQQHFLSARGGRLAYRRWPSESCSRADSPASTRDRGSIVFLHGWGDHGGHYAGLALQLTGHGYSCLAPDFYGHGLSPGPRAKVHDFAVLVEDLHAFLGSVALASPVFLCGHSMGGSLAAHYAIRHPQQIAGIIFNSGAIAVNRRVPRFKRGLCLLLGSAWPSLNVGTLKEAHHMARSQTAQEVYLGDAQIHHGPIDAGTGRSLLKATAWIERRAHQLKAPFLALQGLDDELVSAAGPRTLSELAPSEGTVLEFPGARHDLILDLGVERVATAMLAWLDRQLPSAS